jgi:hypothetical protein
MPDDPLREPPALTIEQAFRAGYHANWIRGEWTFDPALRPGDPAGAYWAWRQQVTPDSLREPPAIAPLDDPFIPRGRCLCTPHTASGQMIEHPRCPVHGKAAARAVAPLREPAEAAPRPDEEPFSEGFWAGRQSDRANDCASERLKAFAAYQRGERWNALDGDLRPLQQRIEFRDGRDA